MKRMIFVVFMLFATESFADLARSMYCYEHTNIEPCKSLLIGTIDAASATNKYCPDGHTSYGFLIEAWERDLNIHNERKNSSTYESMVLTIKNLGLSCEKK